MAVAARSVEVQTTATRLDSAVESDAGFGSAVAVYNNGSETIYLGPSDVTTSSGFPLEAQASLSFKFDSASDELFGVVASGTAEARVIEAGV